MQISDEFGTRINSFFHRVHVFLLSSTNAHAQNAAAQNVVETGFFPSQAKNAPINVFILLEGDGKNPVSTACSGSLGVGVTDAFCGLLTARGGCGSWKQALEGLRPTARPALQEIRHWGKGVSWGRARMHYLETGRTVRPLLRVLS